jgi:predicted DNA-binding transcriptional regulator AlpA
MPPADTRSAEWYDQATEITAAQARKHLPMSEVCERTGLKQVTLQYVINRTGTLRADNPKSHLVRPRYRHGYTPFWDAAQVDAYHEAFAEQVQRRESRWEGLPVVTEEQAKRDKLLTLRGIQRATGYALTSLHRWSNQDGFPRPTARSESSGPNPHLLRDWHAVRDWLRHRNPDREIPDEPPAD